MPKIKFSHLYRKLMDCQAHNTTDAKLLLVQEINLEDMHPAFIEYDTDNGLYELPKKGKFLMLTFLKYMCGEPQHLFTTLRRHTPQKADYYRQQIGKVFDVEIAE